MKPSENHPFRQVLEAAMDFALIVFSVFGAWFLAVLSDGS